MKRFVLLFALFSTDRFFAMEPDVQVAVAQNDSCIVDIEALVGKQVNTSNASTSKQLDFMTVKDGQILVDTAKIPAAVAEFERTTRWKQMSPGARTLIKVTLLGLTAIAASCTGYLTGYDFITLLVGYVTGEAAAGVMRIAQPRTGFYGGAAVFFLAGLIESFLIRRHFDIRAEHGILAGIALTVFIARKAFDWFSYLTGRWTSDSAIYSKLPRMMHEEPDREFAALCQEMETGADVADMCRTSVSIGLDRLA